jgi:hypothetical protein
MLIRLPVIVPDHLVAATGHEVHCVGRRFERALMRWNGDPYQLDGGSGGRARDDGSFILLPYWMGRYHRLIE